ncbi:MAG: hypothetical protein U5R14_06800 [Gemmatimonadota bacterium]|nr:hypothetical protein [Gemmatimonadota bacterium]
MLNPTPVKRGPVSNVTDRWVCDAEAIGAKAVTATKSANERVRIPTVSSLR